MQNPWEEISLEDYENHMSLDSVNQLASDYECHNEGTVLSLRC